MNTKANLYLSLARIGLGLIFLWAFFDKLFGLGRATKASQGWLDGGSPTSGFLSKATQGPLADFYHSAAGSPVVDWLFMIGLLMIGLALLLGIGVRIASYAGTLLMLLMWSAVLPPANHPFLDDHIIYGLLLLTLATSNLADSVGFSRWWSQTSLVQKYQFLK